MRAGILTALKKPLLKPMRKRPGRSTTDNSPVYVIGFEMEALMSEAKLVRIPLWAITMTEVAGVLSL